MKIDALPDVVLVREIQRGERKVGSIILRNDDGESHGIRSRWAQVHAVGENVTDVGVGEFVLLQHGRWTRGFELEDEQGEPLVLYAIDYPNGVLIAAEEIPEGWEETFADDELIQARHTTREGELTESEKKLNISEY